MGRANGKRWVCFGQIAAGLWIALALCFHLHAENQQPVVDKLVLDDTIQPVSADELDRAIARANSDGAHVLLVQMDTPGGLVESMRAMVAAILASHVPVIVYVSPSGSRAGSAGFFILESADIAAMAPGTEAGAAHVVFELGKPDATEEEKVENDAEAFLRSYVTRRGRNTDAAVAAVKSSHSYTPEEALNQHLIDMIANNDAALLNSLDGREITRIDGSKMTLHLAGARIEVLRISLRDELLGWLVNPNIALLFLVGGALLIYLEFNSPGTIVPGALGTLMVLLAVFALNLLPIRYTAVLLLIAAIVLLLLEAKFGGHGALAIAGIVCLTFGMLTLVAAPVPEMGVSPLVAISISVAFGLITVVLVRLAVRARRRKARIGAEAMIGCEATAMESLTPQGHVLVEGEIWRAVASASVAAGSAVRVIGHDEMLLRVEPVAAVKTPGTAA
ncbi:NfeD family protein [Candidatus Sulfotelmatomonas gaucii]|uniref:NfeD family protein n=1 Tax=Candidatus Sulfuritelmatomonas gaucii TaxID=2043161 RepID=A0A2N9LDM6_9BACT|nr:NfeD family protein [Candidatus Sulfotelmatomonas gaucii]